MNDNKLKNMLSKADANAGEPTPVKVNISTIEKQAHRKKIYKIVYPSAAAAVILFAICLVTLFSGKSESPKDPVQLVNEIEIRIKQLNESTDNILNMIQGINKQDQEKKRFDELEAELASIPDPIQKVNEELDKTAFTLIFAADKMYKELNMTDSAVETYKRVIRLFPDNQWAQVARERLDEIQRRNDNDSSKGESQWQKQNILS